MVTVNVTTRFAGGGRRRTPSFNPQPTVVRRNIPTIRLNVQRLTPIDTGRLRRSVRVVRISTGYIIHWLTPYAAAVDRRRPYAARAAQFATNSQFVQVQHMPNGHIRAVVTIPTFGIRNRR